MRSSILSLGLAGLLVACGSDKTGSAGSGATGGTLIIAQPSEGGDSFPPIVTTAVGRLIQDLVYDRLAEINDSLSTFGDRGFKPRLAKSWTWAPDSLSIAFSVDPAARWHDGKPVTAADVRYTFKVFTDTAVGSSTAASVRNIDSVSVRDSLTAVFWFKKHTPEQFYDVAYQLLIVPEHVYGKIPAESLRTSEAVRTPVGSGRFRFVKWEQGSRVELVADTANYRGRPKLDRVLIVKTDPATAAAQVIAGQADVQQSFPLDQASKLDSASSAARPLVLPVLGYVFFAMNAHAPKSATAPNPIFSDIRMRRALSMAVDRVAMLKNMFGDKGRLGHGPFSSSLAFTDTTLALPPYDTTAAKALLDSAGWRAGAGGMRARNGQPLKFSVIVPSSSLPRMRYAVLLQEAFRKVGVQMDLDQMDFPTFGGRFLGSDFSAAMGGFSPDPSPSGAIQNWGTSGIGRGGQNTLRYSNKVVDAALDSATTSFDAAKSKAYATRAFKQIIADIPGIWLYDVIEIDAVNRRLEPKGARADGWWANLGDWSIPSDKRIDRDRIGLTPAKP